MEVLGTMLGSKGHALGYDVKAYLSNTMPNLVDVLVHLEPVGGATVTNLGF